MKEKKKRFLIWIGLVCLMFGLFASCGHAEEKEESHEERTSKTENSSDSPKYGKYEEVPSPNVSEKVGGRTEFEKYWGTTDSAIESFDPGQEETKSQGNFNGAGAKLEDEAVKEEMQKSQPEMAQSNAFESVTAEYKTTESVANELAVPEPYYLTEADKSFVIAQLVSLGESYGLTYYPDVTESETWDSPTPIYEEELILGRDHVISTMLEYTEGAFVLMQIEGCHGFALSIRQQPDTVTDAYYEVYVYWM